MYSIELQTIFYEYQNKNPKINTSFVRPARQLSADIKMKNETPVLSARGEAILESDLRLKGKTKQKIHPIVMKLFEIVHKTSVQKFKG